jgi:hypothetical protein
MVIICYLLNALCTRHCARYFAFVIVCVCVCVCVCICGIGVPFTLWEADFHKIKGSETISRSHKDLIIIHDNVGLTESFFPISWAMECAHGNLKFLVLKFLLIYFFDHSWSNYHVNKSALWKHYIYIRYT